MKSNYFGGFIEYMGFRNMLVEEKIHEALRAAENGAESVTFDRGDLTDDEIEYIQEEVLRRIGPAHRNPFLSDDN